MLVIAMLFLCCQLYRVSGGCMLYNKAYKDHVLATQSNVASPSACHDICKAMSSALRWTYMSDSADVDQQFKYLCACLGSKHGATYTLNGAISGRIGCTGVKSCVNNGVSYPGNSVIKMWEGPEGTCYKKYCNGEGKIEQSTVDCGGVKNCIYEGKKYPGNSVIKKYQDKSSGKCTKLYCNNDGDVEEYETTCDKPKSCIYDGVSYPENSLIKMWKDKDGKCYKKYCNGEGEIEDQNVNCDICDCHGVDSKQIATAWWVMEKITQELMHMIN